MFSSLHKLGIVASSISSSGAVGYLLIIPSDKPKSKELLSESDYDKALGPRLNSGRFVNLDTIQKWEEESGCKILFVQEAEKGTEFAAVKDEEWTHELQKEMLESLNRYPVEQMKQLCSSRRKRKLTFARDNQGRWWSTKYARDI